MNSRGTSPELRATLLLCGAFDAAGDGGPQPLSPGEFGDLLRVLRRLAIPLEDLLTEEGERRFREDLEGAARFDGRIGRLLDRHADMESAMDRWERDRIRVIDRTHDDYPERYRELLAERAPPLLWAAGDLSQVNSDEQRVAVVGSRDIDRETAGFAWVLGSRVAGYGARIVSGGARGVDRTAVDGALDAGGRATVLLPGDLKRVVALRRFQRALTEGRLLIMSPWSPEEPFIGRNALGRNRLIYCLADVAVVVETSLHSGGTWAGATEALRLGRIPVYVRQTGQPSPGNQELIRLGGKPFPHDIVDDPQRFASWLEPSVREARSSDDSGNDHRQLGLFTGA